MLRDEPANLWPIYVRDPEYAIQVIKARTRWAELTWELPRA